MAWSKDKNGNWRNIEDIDVYDTCFEGLNGICVVFKMFNSNYASKESYRVIRTGRGHIRSILDQYIAELKGKNKLYVTWLITPSFIPEFLAGLLDEKLELIMKN
ncbi:hypothetical protein HZA73_09405 [candidate division TA06 bacterium]|nr:hypothetical protein [candidate division TA06 bacterium]